MEWESILGFEAIPKAYNPTQGYLSNWTNRPAQDKTNTDTYFWSYGDRVNELNDQYDEKEQCAPQELWDFNKIACYKDVNWHYFLPYLAKTKVQLPCRESHIQNLVRRNILTCACSYCA